MGDIVDLLLKPNFLRDWELVRETKKCYVLQKYRKYNSSPLYVPKKTVLQIIKKV